MFRELESIFAKWGFGLILLSGAFASMILLNLHTGTLLSIEFTAGTLLLGGLMVATSFMFFRAGASGRERQLDALADTSFPTTNHQSLLGVTWLAFLALPVGVLALKLTGIADGTNFYDFGAYYNTGERVVHGYPLYDWTTPYAGVTDLPNSPNRYLYAPLVSLIFAPFAYLPHETAALVWSGVSITTYLVGITFFLRSLNINLDAEHWVVVLTGALGFGPFVITFIAGQVTGVLAGCLCLAGASLTTERQADTRLIGVLTTIPVVFKVYYAPAGAPLLRDNRRLATALIAGLAIAALGVFVFGVNTTIEYLHVLAGGKGWGAVSDPPDAWNINDFHPLYYASQLAPLVRGMLLATIAAVAYRSRQYDFEYVDLYVYSFGLLGVALGVPVFTTSGLTVLVPVTLFLLVTTYQARPIVFAATIIATVLIHAHPYTNELLAAIVLPQLGLQEFGATIMPLVQPAVWGVLLLLACVTYEYTRRTPSSASH